MRHFISCLLICITFTASAQELTGQFGDLENWTFTTNGFSYNKGNLDIKILKKWLSETRQGSIYIVDTINTEALRFELQYAVPLPQDSVFLSFDFKNKNLETLDLRLYFYGDRELFIDSLVIPLRPDGHNRIGFNKPVVAEWAEIKLDGRRSDLRRDTVVFQVIDACIEAKSLDIDEWSCSMDFDIDAASLFPLEKITVLDELHNKKIIGLGGSVYGSRTLFKEKVEIAQKLLDKNVKLICFEQPVDMCLNWDLYVQGVHPYRYRDIILRDLNYSLTDAADMVCFLDQIREINSMRKKEEKIHIVGLDLRSDKSYFYHYFMAYKNLSRDKQFLNPLLFEMNYLEYDYLSYINTLIINKKRIEKNQRDTLQFKFNRLSESILSEKKLKSIMADNDYRFILDLLSLDVPTFYDEREYKKVDRDSFMWAIFQKATAHYAPEENDRALIFAHSLHLSRSHHERYSLSGLMKDISLGSYIAKTYPNNYWSISFHVGGGEIKSYDPVLNLMRKDKISGIEKLCIPMHGSFERSAKNIYLNRFYCKSDDLGRDMYTFRMMGNRAGKDQFNFLSKDRFDAFVYINESVPSRAGCYDAGYTFPNIAHYTDSLKLIDVPYSKTFAFEPTCFDIAIPEDFRYKNFNSRVMGIIGIVTGIFESKDKHCLMAWESFIKIYDKQSSWHDDPKIDSFLKKEMSKEVMRELKHSLEMDMEYYETSSKREASNENFEKLYYASKDKIVNDKGNGYAKKVFNADHVVDFIVNENLYFMGKDYKHKQVILIGKGDVVLTLNAYYTDEGFANLEKYRNGIESIIRFHN